MINYVELPEFLLEYQEAGFSVFPLKSKGKTPLTSHGLKDAINDIEQIKSWWQQWPDANIGIATGAVSGFWVLDVDGEEGEASLQELEQKHGPLPVTREVITGGGGRHLYFLKPSAIQIRNSARQIGAGLDIRGDGGYVVAPPSIHSSGMSYEWSVDGAAAIIAAPEWLLKLVSQPQDQEYTSTSDWKEALKGVSEGQRNDSLAKIAGAVLSPTPDPAVFLQLLLAWNDNRCNPPLSHEEVVRTYESIAKREEEKKLSALSTDDVEIICMKDVKMEKINWLWPDRIACGKLTVIAGNPGLGKSQITANIAATVTTGGKWPDTGDHAPKGNVIILSAEDDAADTIKPRLVAAGADVSRCHVLKAIKAKDKTGKETERGFDLNQDVARLEKAIKQTGNVKLLIIDPISSYMGKTDSNNNTETRGLLAPLAAMAEQCGVAVLLITHLNKSQSQDVLGRVIGSIGLIAAARAGYAVVKNGRCPDSRYFVPIKNNIGNDHNGFSFQIETALLEQDIKTSKICWGELVEAQTVLNPVSEEKRTAKTRAEEFLEGLLINGPMLKDDIDKRARIVGISDSALQRAKKNLTVQARKLSMTEGWEWSIYDPEDFTPKQVPSSTPSYWSSLPLEGK